MSDPMKLFVYGTLRRGAPMHGLIDGRARFEGPARAPGRLVDLGSFPALVPSRRARDEVHGDLFALEPDTAAELIDTLDRYEGAQFQRECVVVHSDAGEVEAWLYCYRGDARSSKPIAGGDYLARKR